MKISRYPLYSFYSDLDYPCQIDKGISIDANDIVTDKLQTYNVSIEDEHHLNEADSCLKVDEDVTLPSQASIAFIVACRLLKPTRVFIRYRVDSSNTVHKSRDDYSFSRNAEEIIDKGDFKTISELFIGLNKFKVINTRTGNATYFLGLAIRSRGWLESLIFYVCALETITSSPNVENKITEKFTNRIYNFIGYDQDKLKEIYNIRSKLVHGRYDFQSEEENLRLNEIAEEVCRKVFSKILLDTSNISAFENDETRLKLFQRA